MFVVVVRVSKGRLASGIPPPIRLLAELAAVNALDPVIRAVKTHDVHPPTQSGRTAPRTNLFPRGWWFVSHTAAARRDVRSSVLALADRRPSLSRRAVAWTVARKEDVQLEFVQEELDALERAGEIYLVGSGETAEVRRT